MNVLQQSFRHPGVRFIAGGWSLFIIENVIVSENRDVFIQYIGENFYHVAYSSISTVACGSIVWGLLKHGIKKGPTIATKRGKFAIATSFVLQAIGLLGFSQMIPKIQMPVDSGTFIVGDKGKEINEKRDVSLPGGIAFNLRCPMDFRAKDAQYAKEQGTEYGVDRVTRHPLLWSLGLFGAGHAMRSIYVTEIVMGTFPLIFSYIGGAHQDSRHRRGSGGILSPHRETRTSNVPFLALVAGKQSFTKLSEEIKWSNAAIAILIALKLVSGRRR